MPTFRIIRPLITVLLSLCTIAPAAAQVGLQRQTWAAGKTPGLVWYPTAASATTQRMGPFEMTVAMDAKPSAGRHPLVLISHGTGGNALGHAWLAQTLAAEGYVVAALRQPGDNFQDRSGVGSGSYFSDRPRHVSQVLDELLADPRWAPLIDSSRIAAIGHSAGGHTVLALAGARPDRARWLAHCSADGVGLREDPALCSLGGFSSQRPAPRLAPESPLPELRDSRIRAVVAAATMAMALDPASLRAVDIPVHLENGARDEVLAPRHHGQPLCAAMPQAACLTDVAAGHYALFQPGTGPLGPPALDPAADPPGFDRAAWQAGAATRIKAFLAAALK